MSELRPTFKGKWLSAGNRQGQDFSHDHPEYDHKDDPGSNATRMRHATVDQEGRPVGVWVPADWDDDQVRDALATNW